ncbi:MAG: hypothetical protein UU57_C0039G0002 [Candidatus Woesebacteria bacterium GW2011_GWE1_41_24]|uniref:Uncharacterized protein n=1 Tax=Candidatus Woesebacteria bacterium GW2011_GWE1_41_24 TaxID=1618597 RepID=A0A0G0Y0T2_9BACT|nr:MAG: hypothetical protein UU57_C0039G0002 [Candidatus Woesebacteria bacterium GW2011_GWE1_41_24]
MAFLPALSAPISGLPPKRTGKPPCNHLPISAASQESRMSDNSFRDARSTSSEIDRIPALLSAPKSPPRETPSPVLGKLGGLEAPGDIITP